MQPFLSLDKIGPQYDLFPKQLAEIVTVGTYKGPILVLEGKK